ncbi:MAG TPA: M15 family metallopeptidase [Actinomycetota bacterium]|nr:M15 family metallopeptidase [Actinomycetota bacterium]
MTRRPLALALAALVLASCGARVEPGRERTGPFSQVRAVRLPEPPPAQPAYVVESDEPLDPAALARLARTPGVAVVAPVGLAEVAVEGPDGRRRRLDVGAVDPLSFRALAPAATRAADFVWVSLIGGRTVLTFDAARALGIEDAGAIEVAGDELAVGAFADNGIPNVADVLVDASVGRRLGLGDATVALVGAEPGAPVDGLRAALRRRVPGAELRALTGAPAPLEPPGEPLPLGRARGGVVGTMRYRVLDDGFIEPDPAWVDEHIVDAEVPVIGAVRCHRILVPQLRGALEEVERAGLAPLLRPDDYGGCYVPRFIDRDPSNPLSMHAFGLAVDLNVSTNLLGTRGDMDPRVVAIFERWGFAWGGRWSRPDPMHFELERILRS